MKKIFISYNKHDQQWAEWIAWTLEEHGFPAIIQAWDFRPGRDFILEMHKVAAGTHQTLAVLSDEYLNAEYTQPEWAAAFARDPRGDERILVPVRVSECRPTGLLAARIYADLVGLSAVDAREVLLNAFAERAKPSSAPSFPGNTIHGRQQAQQGFPGHESIAIDVWQEKLAFLQAQQAVLGDPGQLVALGNQIEEIERRLHHIRSASPGKPVPSLVTQSGEHLRHVNVDRHVQDELTSARARQASLRAQNEDTTDVDGEILRLRRSLRRGVDLKRGDELGGGRYCLLSRLGDGGFATVWQARDAHTHCDVAVKVLKKQRADDPISKERFFRGARIMSELAPSNGVVSVLETKCEEHGIYYFVMELMRGGNLRDAVLSRKITHCDAVRIMSRMLEVLSYAHRQPAAYVHRDIKPTNVLLAEDFTIRLTDFDLVAARDTTGGTQAGMLGTIGYAAPEQLLRPQDADCRADLYSVALTGMFVLFEKDLPDNEIFTPRRAFIQSLPTTTRVKNVLTRAIRPKPEERFESAEDFRCALYSGLPPRRVTDSQKAGSATPARELVRRQKKRYPIPDIHSRKVLEALRMFDRDHRDASKWRGFTDNPRHRYAITFEGKLYPVKLVMSLATGIPIAHFSGGSALNKRVTDLGFKIVHLRTEDARA